MLSKLKITFKDDQKINIRNATLFHGAIMEIIDKNYAELLHNLSYNPYTQALVYNKEEGLYWEITTLGKNAKANIIDKLNDDINSILLSHNNIKLEFIEKNLSTINYDDFIEKYYFKESSRYKRIKFLTPTAFKVNGQYQIYPTVKHIFNSIINKHDFIQGDTAFYSKEVIEQIEKGVSIVNYNLRSVKFDLEGIRIPSFIGEVTLKVDGTKQFSSFIETVLQYGVYSGVGIKSSLGMGKIIKL